MDYHADSDHHLAAPLVGALVLGCGMGMLLAGASLVAGFGLLSALGIYSASGAVLTLAVLGLNAHRL